MNELTKQMILTALENRDASLEQLRQDAVNYYNKQMTEINTFKKEISLLKKIVQEE